MLTRMSYYRRANTPGASYFFTVVTYQRRHFLCDSDVRSALREAIQATRIQQPFRIDAWVLLPDHLHAIWTLPPGDADFASRWGKIKRYVTLCCGERLHQTERMSASRHKHRESTLWQRRYWEHQIRNEQDMAHHLDYLHFNPVKHGLTVQVADWPYSSFHRYVKAGKYAPDWGDESRLNVPGQRFGE
jgi:putative transposase